MRMHNFLAMLMSLLIMDYSVFINSVLSQTLATEGLQWGTMGTYLRENEYVRHLEEDQSKPGNILYSSGSTLMTTDGITTHLVVGLGTFGYAEGGLAQAEFGHITGFLQTSSSQVLLVDHNNHCLRYLNRTTSLTSPFVGNCTSGGFSDGLYRNARFSAPWCVIRNLVNPQSAIVTDYGNKAVRSIDLAEGDVKTIIKDLPSNPLGEAFDSDKENIFITFHSFLGKLNLKTLVFTQLTPAANTGGLDGEFSKASFGSAYGILCMNKVCLIADHRTNRLRAADVAKQTIYSICTGDDSSVDGTTTNCSLRGPKSLLLTSDTLYIGEYQAIRKISVRGFFPCKDISLKLSAGEQSKCVEIVPGHNICFTPGITTYSILEKNCTIKINVTKDLGVCQNNPCLNYGICIAGENNTYMCDCKDGWAGSNCQTVPRLMMRLDVSANYKLSCTTLQEFKQLVLSLARTRYTQIRQLSSGSCNKSADHDIIISCAADVLQIVWPTDCLFDSGSTKERQRLLAVVDGYLDKHKVFVLDLFIPNQEPPIIQPFLNEDGRPVSVIWAPVCSGGLKYMNSTETCQ